MVSINPKKIEILNSEGKLEGRSDNKRLSLNNMYEKKS